MVSPRMSMIALEGIPLISAGDDLAEIIAEALDAASVIPEQHDILVVAQKIISKAEGRQVDLQSVTPSDRAKELAAKVGKDARHIEMILQESGEVLRVLKEALITEHRLGFILANAGVDQSNIDHGACEGGRVLLLPENPDRSAECLKEALDSRYGVKLGVIINDSAGRAWRNGIIGMAIGAAGVPSVQSLVGRPDLFGRPLRITEQAAADEIASAASLLMGQAGEGLPVVHVRGLRYDAQSLPAKALIRPKHQDVFR